MLSSVRYSSVDSGRTSLTDPTKAIRQAPSQPDGVGPVVIADGRTTGPAARTSQTSPVGAPQPAAARWSLIGPGGRAARCGQVLANPGHDHGHLVGDQPDVRLL